MKMRLNGGGAPVALEQPGKGRVDDPADLIRVTGTGLGEPVGLAAFVEQVAAIDRRGHPKAVFLCVGLHFRPDNFQGSDGVSKANLDPPGSFVALPELGVQMPPRDEALPLGSVAPPVQEQDQILELRLLARAANDVRRDRYVVANQFVVEIVADLHAVKNVLADGNAFAAPYFGAYVNTPWKMSAADDGHVQAVVSSRAQAANVNREAADTLKSFAQVGVVLSTGCHQHGFQEFFGRFPAYEAQPRLDGLVQKKMQQASIGPVGEGTLGSAGKYNNYLAAISEARAPNDPTVVGWAIRQPTEDERLSHLKKFCVKNTGVALLAQ